MTPAQINSLISRLEKEEVDYGAWEALTDYVTELFPGRGYFRCYLEARGQPNPTLLLPIAVALVPEGHWWRVGDDARPSAGQALAAARVAPLSETRDQVFAYTPAAALAIASLRARRGM